MLYVHTYFLNDNTSHKIFHGSLYLQTKAVMNKSQTHDQFQKQEKLNHHKNWYDDIFL